MIWMCEPNPMILRRISFLKPVTVATEMIMTARLRAIPATEMRMMGPEKEARLSLLKVKRVAMNSPVFKNGCSMGSKDIKYCCAETRLTEQIDW
jgi:hypothetical protein